jgi:superfamily II DNA helicase RecQ
VVINSKQRASQSRATFEKLDRAKSNTHALGEGCPGTLFYHASLKAKDRNAIQDAFTSGDAPVIVATNAFSMCVDKPNIRFVYHYDIPIVGRVLSGNRAGR